MPVHKTMRITGGSLLSRRFLMPPMVDKGAVRPTPDRVREAIFSMIIHDLKDATVLDLFAGSGAHGFEAVSRGAASVRFIEKDRDTAAVIKQNIESLGLARQCSVEVADACHVILAKPIKPCDIIFVDPPYSQKLTKDFIEALLDHLSPNGVVIYRCFKKEYPPITDAFIIDRDRIYGGTRVFVLRRALT